MSSFRKNLMVGLTVLGSLGLLGFMIVKFGDAPARLFRPSRIPVQFQTSRADGLSTGSNIYYKGVPVGTIEGILLSDDETSVLINARVDGNKLPGNVVGNVRSQLVSGGSSISLELPENESPKGKLQAGQKVAANFLGVDVLPPAIGNLAESLRQTVDEFHRSHFTQNINDTIKAVHLTADATTKVLESVQKLVGDNRTQEDLHAALANVRAASESATRIGTNLDHFTQKLDKIGGSVESLTTRTASNLDEVTHQLNDRLEQMSKLLDTFGAIAGKVNNGQGTAGLLINDGKLYEGLVDVSKELAGTVREVKLLVEQIQQEGFHLKLGGK